MRIYSLGIIVQLLFLGDKGRFQQYDYMPDGRGHPGLLGTLRREDHHVEDSFERWLPLRRLGAEF